MNRDSREANREKASELRYWLGREISDKRTRILASAQAVFAEQGFRTAEVRTIAERAGVGKATIYKFFPGKEALLLVIVEESLNYVRDLALASLLASGDPLQRLENAAVSMARFLEQNRQFARILIQEAGEFTGEIQRRHLAMVEQNLPFAEAFFATLRDQGYFQALGTRETIHLMMNSMVGAIYTWAVTGDGKLEEQALRYLRVLIEGLRTDPRKINRPVRRP
jgi:AcrR family transcriptional regulator